MREQSCIAVERVNEDTFTRRIHEVLYSTGSPGSPSDSTTTRARVHQPPISTVQEVVSVVSAVKMGRCVDNTRRIPNQPLLGSSGVTISMRTERMLFF